MKNVYSSVLCLMLSVANLFVFAQTYPYPQNITYEYGYMSDKITEPNAWAEYESWIKLYYVECPGGEARIDYNGSTVSEGIGYGLVITAYAGDKEKFDKLLKYYNARLTGNGVMNWEYRDCGTSPSGSGAATDGDLDAVMGILVAVHQWPGQGYDAAFKKLAGSIRGSEFDTGCGLIVQKPGDVWGGCDCTNPSYFAPGYYRAFSKFYEKEGDSDNANFWSQAATDAYVVLFKNQNSSSGLVSAWSNSNGAVGGCGGQVSGGAGPSDYQYDACRTPWRIATDFLWWGASDAQRFLEPIVDFVKTDVGGIEEVLDGYAHNGTVLDKPAGNWHTVPFVGSFALSGMATSQQDADDFMRHFSTMKGDNYFNTCLSVMYRFLATGNFWNPYGRMLSIPRVYCSEVDLGNDKTLCGSGSVELNAGLSSASGRTFTWFRNDSELQSGSGNTFLATQDGVYKVVMDSAGQCSSEAKVTISATLPALELGEKFLFAGSGNLDAKLEGAGLNYTWYFNGDEIAGKNDRVLAVSQVGTYKVEISAEGCPSVSGQVVAEELPSLAFVESGVQIDGVAESAYANFVPIEQKLSGNIGAPNIAAQWCGLWDNSNAYFFIDVTDDNLSADGGDWWQNDGIEIFIDGDNSKGGGYDSENDFQFGFVWQSSSVQEGSNPDGATNGIEYKMIESDNGYALEVSIPWSVIGATPQEGTVIGFDIAINDDDWGGERENKISWNQKEDIGYQKPSAFGTVGLIASNVVEEITQEIQLQRGWNLISISVVPQVTAIAELFEGVDVVKNFDGHYDFRRPLFTNSLLNIVPGEGYLIYVENQKTISITGLPVEINAIQSLPQGWSLVANITDKSVSVPDAFGNEQNTIQAVKDFTSFWERGGTGSLQNIDPGKAYFVLK